MGNFQVSLPSSYVLGFAIEVAAARESPSLEARDLLAGLYMGSSKRLSKYWKKLRAFDRLVAREPGIRELIAAYRRGEFPSPAQIEQIRLRCGFVPFAPEITRVMETARDLGASRQGAASGDKPVLAPEDFLLAIAKHTELEVGQRLVASGLDLRRLEKAVETLKTQLA
jgi:hypothetical protein